MTKRRVKIDIPVRQQEKLIELAEAIYKQSRSKLIPDHEIDFHSFHNNTLNAKDKRINAKVLYEKSRLITQEANELIGIGRGQNKSTPDTLYNIILLIRNHLKILFKGEEEKLRDWGYDVEVYQIRDLRKVKIHIPISSAEHLLILSETIYDRHLQNPLVLRNFNLKGFNARFKKAKEKRTEAKDISDSGDQLMEESMNLLGFGYGQTKETPGTVYNQVNEVLKILQNKYKGEEEKISEWGFKTIVVNSTFPIKGNVASTKKIIAITKQIPLITIRIIFKGSNGKKVYVAWGDGTADKINLIGHTTPNSIYHDYLEERDYEIQISGDIGKLSYLKINGNQIISVDLPKNLKNLSNLSIKNNLIDSHKIINDILSNIDSAGVFNGELDISGGSNTTPSSYGNISKSNLINRGWDIITN
jgi:hypothetical protein